MIPSNNISRVYDPHTLSIMAKHSIARAIFFRFNSEAVITCAES
jgi:hypothetical protein